MTILEALIVLTKLPPNAPLCFSVGETLVEVSQIDMVPAAHDGDHYAAAFESAGDDAIRVAVVA